MILETERVKLLKKSHEKVHFLRELDRYYSSLDNPEKRVFKWCYYLTIIKTAHEYYKFKNNFRTKLSHAIRSKTKCSSAIQDLGCTIEQFREHLETKFYDNPYTGEKMSWENYGFYGWRLDYIKPIDLTNKRAFIETAHYTNYQPVWSMDNFKKGDKY